MRGYRSIEEKEKCSFLKKRTKKLFIRWTFHFTPTSDSWFNAVEGFFAKLTRRRLKRGVFHSVVDLQAAIKRFLAENNDNPKPFRWTKEPEEIIATARRRR